MKINKNAELPKTVSKTESMFYNELNEFKGENVTIVLISGHSVHAKILAIEFKGLNFIIEHPDGLKEMINGESIQSVRMGNKIEKD